MRARREGVTEAQLAFVVGAVTLVAYLLTRTRDFGGDDTVFAMAVDRFLAGNGAERALVHPHHPIYNPIVAGLTWLLRSLGLRAFVPDVGAAVSSLAAAIVAGGLVWLLCRAGVRREVAALAGAVASASGGLWHFGTCMEVYALTAVLVTAWLAVAGRESPDPRAAGAAVAAATLGHLSAGLLVAPTVVRLRRRPKSAAGAAALAAGLTLVLVAANLTLFHHASTPGAWFRSAVPGPRAPYLSAPNPPAAIAAVFDLVAWRWYRSVPVYSPATAHWFDVAGALAAALLFVAFAAGLVAASRGRHPMAVTAALALLAYLPLWLVWDVGNVEHVVAATPLFATVTAFGAASLARRLGEVVLGAALALLLVANGLGSAVPQSRVENSRPCIVASFVAEALPPEAVLLTVGVEPRLRLALPYLCGRRVVTLALDVQSARAQGRDPLTALAYWVAAGEQARSLWVTPDVLAGSTTAEVVALGIPAPVWTNLVARARTLERRVLPPDGVAVLEPFVLTRISVAGGQPPS